MSREIIKGKKIRTNNSRMEEVMGLWQTVLPLNLSGDLYAVYYNFESNHLGDYDFLIGTKEAQLEESIELVSTNYLEIPVDGNSIENLGKTWFGIWNNPEIEAKRSYQTDYEKYYEDGRISIFLSIK